MPSASNARFRIALLPGDGIGTEVIDATIKVLAAAQEKIGGFTLDLQDLPAGATLYKQTGEAFPDESRKASAEADAILLGAMGMPDIRYPDGTEIAPQLDLRFDHDLYAGVRPIRSFPRPGATPGPLADPRAAALDFVLIRESTEGLFASRGKGVVEDDAVARDTMVITRHTSERLFDFTLRLAQRRKALGHPGRATCVDKANVFASMAFFRKIFEERAAAFPDVAIENRYIDATALELVRQPWIFDVMVTENMFGDILSDLAAGLVGGMGMAPSADIGDSHAVFQPAHGSAPDIAGKGLANPTATILSAAMMLDWLGDRHGVPACVDAAQLIDTAVAQGFTAGAMNPPDLGGSMGTEAMTKAVIAAMAQV